MSSVISCMINVMNMRVMMILNIMRMRMNEYLKDWMKECYNKLVIKKNEMKLVFGLSERSRMVMMS